MDFFEFHEKATKRAGKGGPPARGEVLTVSELTSRIEKAIKGALPGSLGVQGEVSNFKHHAGSGHLYFTLKDANACIDCVMFKSDASRLRFTPEDGIEVLATGHVAVYGQRGKYQLYVSRLEPVGQGALELAFRQLCVKLEAEGLFAKERKRPIPGYPQRVALVTSVQTAAMRDMLKVLGRYPWVRVLVYHVPVQGEGAGEKIAEALGDLSRRAAEVGGVDVILLGRGGGSLEDLWAFNEEVVARAVAGSAIPIISGIGHETDVSVADLVADYHAHTPTEAAQVAMGQWRSARDEVEAGGMRLRREMRTVWQEARGRLMQAARHEAFRRPMDRVNAARQLLDDRQRAMALAVGRRLRRWQAVLHDLASRLEANPPRHAAALWRERLVGSGRRLEGAMAGQMGKWRKQVEAMAGHLTAVGPEQVLRRGYSITTLKKRGVVVRSEKEVGEGDRLVTRLADGQIESVAEDSAQLRLFE